MRTMYFVGVTTGQSASAHLFPRWAEALGIVDGRLRGVDVPLRSHIAVYRKVVEDIKRDPLVLGALITSHKLGIFEASADLLDQTTEDAALTREVSCLYKRDGRLVGHATDPTVSGRALESLVSAGHPGDVLCLGAGGTGCAILTYFVVHCPACRRPGRFLLVERDPRQLRSAEQLVARLPGPDFNIEMVLSDEPERNDDLVAHLPECSLVINATGMGKDLPGSPITDKAVFPRHAAVWELNYRGELEFLRQARRQERERQLTIEDGWRYFLLSWSLIVGLVFDVPVDEAAFSRFAAASGRNSD